MRKLGVRLVVGCVVIILAFMVWYLIYHPNPREKVIKLLPSFQLTDIDEIKYTNDDFCNNKFLFFYSVTCNYCINEIEEISLNIELLSDYDIIFVTDSITELSHIFTSNYIHPRLFFLFDQDRTLYEKLGVVDNPTIFIFSKGDSLFKRYNGAVPLSLVINDLETKKIY